MRKRDDARISKKKPAERLSREQQNLAREMFFGPYKPEWRDSEGIVDNRDSTIAKRIGVETGAISAYTEKIATVHFTKVLKSKQKSK